ncbi:hypothetical protein C942_01948 [Photobacterium marinum]|uniref:Uncharacterized protein n=1 Tax=Photobacterium marinum TaxID=1056511 RepID=L8J9I1_9GAMM|nr:hypothetical protein C942_01948 [Photobacterium marinum]
MREFFPVILLLGLASYQVEIARIPGTYHKSFPRQLVDECS